jgi:hypothetical protein
MLDSRPDPDRAQDLSYGRPETLHVARREKEDPSQRRDPSRPTDLVVERRTTQGRWTQGIEDPRGGHFLSHVAQSRRVKRIFAALSLFSIPLLSLCVITTAHAP